MTTTHWLRGARASFTLLTIAALFAITGCGGKKSGPVASGGGATTMPKTFKSGPDSTVAPELGGPGFERIAADSGWSTGTIAPDQIKYIGDPNAKKGGMLTSAEQDFPATFRTYGKDANSTTIQLINDMVYESLITTNPLTLEFLPKLATHWKVSDDGQTYYFRINPNAHFSDGHPVTTDDVLATYKLVTDSTILDPFSRQLFGTQYDPPKKISKYIVSVHSKEKNWKNMLYFGGLQILPSYLIDTMSGTEYLDKYQYAMLPGSGPYVILPQDTRKGQSFTLTRLTDWWGRDLPSNTGNYNFDKIKVLSIEDENLRYEKFRAGDVDFHIEPRAQFWKTKYDFDLIDRGIIQKRKVYNDKPQGLQAWAFNMRRWPFNDPKVREAFTLLINRKKLIQQIMYNEYEISDSYYPGSDYANPNNPKYRYDPERALQLLKEAGFTSRNSDGILVDKDNGRPFKIELPLPKGSEHIQTPIQQDLKKVGIQMDIRFVDYAQLFKLTAERNFDIAYVGYAGLIYPNPYGTFHSSMADAKNTNNITGFKNARADQIIEQELVTYDYQKRVKLIRELDSILMASHAYALSWYAPFTRVIYWNYLGHPDYYLSRYGDYRDIYILWWVDPDKQQKVHEARGDASITMPVGDTKVEFWPEYDRQHSGQTPAPMPEAVADTATSGADTTPSIK